MTLRLVAMALAALVSGCMTGTQVETRYPSTIAAREYNSIAARYMDRPTFVVVRALNDGTQVLRVDRQRYTGQVSGFAFIKGHAATYEPLIQKYLEWESMAIARGDALTKEIGRGPTRGMAGQSGGEVKFTFHSGSAKVHYLMLSFCAFGTCLEDDAFYLDRDGATELITLLRRFESGALAPKDTGSVYR